MIVRILIAAAFLAMLVGCGFHLRNAKELPQVLQTMYIVSDTHDAILVRELRRDLRSESITLQDYPAPDSAVLSIIDSRQGSRPLVFNGLGQPLLYEAAYTVEYTLVAGGIVLIPPESLTQTRNYNYSVTNGLANQEQENTIYGELAKQMAQLIIYRLDAVAKSIPTATPLPHATTQSPSAATRAATPAATQTAPAAVTGVPPTVTHALPMVD